MHAARIVVPESPFLHEATAALRAHLDHDPGAVVFDKSPRDPDELADRMRGADSVIHFFHGPPLNTTALQSARPRQVVVAGPVGASLDVGAARAAGIVVYDTPGLAADSVAEFTIAVTLGLCHGVHRAARAMAAGEWHPTVGCQAQRQRLGVVGVGRIGRRVVELAGNLGMSVDVWSPSLTEGDADHLGVTLHHDLDDLLRAVDIVTLHLRLTPSTERIIDRRRVGLLHPGTLIVNTARAGLVDTVALSAAITTGHLGGTALDVFGTEPLAADDPLRTHPSVLATPHMAWMTTDAIDRFVNAAVGFALHGDVGHVRQVT